MFERFFTKLSVPSTPSVCQFESNNNDCSLIQQLKDKQAELKEVEAEIKKMETFAYQTYPMLCFFLTGLEKEGIHLEKLHANYCMFEKAVEFNSTATASKIGACLDKFTDHAIEELCDEIKSFKNYKSTLLNLRKEQSRLQGEITKIKNELGIE